MLVTSGKQEVQELTNLDASPQVAVVTASPLPLASPIVDTSTTIPYTSSDGTVSFAYPAYFSLKQSDPDCSFCPELVLENEDERLWFGTLPPGSQTKCEAILQHHELPAEDATVIWYEYQNKNTEECSQAGDIHGFKATVEADATIYYVDYLPDFSAGLNQEEIFLEIARSIRLHSQATTE
jgi:hypothetical protein